MGLLPGFTGAQVLVTEAALTVHAGWPRAARCLPQLPPPVAKT
jgi:hypothetical protein